ncbi:MAG: hypothetical protein WA102_08525 [Candidatus Methanoperedens sp.]
MEKVMPYGYGLTKEKREKLTKIDYPGPSKSKDNFDQNYANSIILLHLIDKIHDSIDFTNEEIKFYENLVMEIRFYGKNQHIMIKENLDEMLRDLIITNSVSNWEGYFSDISDVILIDNILEEKIYKDKEKLKKFLTEFNLWQDFNSEMLLNRFQVKGLKFANYIKTNHKINYQNIEYLKKFLNILYDIDIVKIDEKNWTEIVKFIDDRHKTIHNKFDRIQYCGIMQKYTKDKIENIMNNMKKIIDEIDNIFFTVYQ